MKLFAIIAVALAGLAFWRRKDIASGAKQASRSAKEVASSTREKLGHNGEAPDEADDTSAEKTDQANGDTTSQTESDEPAAAASGGKADPDGRSG